MEGEYEDSGVDRISALPDYVIHVILSLVPTVDVVRMSLLSKRWRRMWRSVPALQFCCFGFEGLEAFDVFLENYLTHRQRGMRFLDSSAVTSLTISTYSSSAWFAALDSWICSNVLMNNLKELHLCFLDEPYPEAIYTLPSPAMNGRFLACLKLEGRALKLTASCPVDLPSLKYLLLADVVLDSDTLSNLFNGCSALEECVVGNIPLRVPLLVSSLSLRILEIKGEVRSGNIQASKLESLTLMNVSCFGLDFSACKAIKDLVIEETVDMEINNFEDQISKLPLLENMVLTLENVEQLTISSRSLKHVVVHDFGTKIEVAIDTPNLGYLGYVGNMNVRMSTGLFNHFVKAEFSVCGSYSELINFFSHINPTWNSFEISLDIDEDHVHIDLPKNLRKIDIPPWHNLEAFGCQVWVRMDTQS